MDDLLLRLVNLSKIRPTGCLEYQGKRLNEGHGYIWLNGKTTVVSRLAYELTYGEIPKDKCVLHTCDNPPCINPMHLYVGTKLDNSNDMVLRGRDKHQSAEENGNACLNWEKVRQIRAEYKKGWSASSIAKEFNVHRCHVWRIVQNKTWKE